MTSDTSGFDRLALQLHPMIPQPAFSQLEAAYQLHFYLCLKTHYLREVFVDDALPLIEEVVADVCRREDYHLLESQLAASHLRLLISLKPTQTVSRVIRMLKGNLSRRFSQQWPKRLAELRMKTLWADGYFARSSGKVNLETVRQYIDSQPAHHGYRGTWTEALRFHNPEFHSPAFPAMHSYSVLQYHLVFITKFRRPLFDDTIAPKLFAYLLLVGKRKTFAVERLSVLPDHIHLLIEGLPSVSINDYALALVNNLHYWMGKNYWGVLKGLDAWDVWQPSYYAGTVGEYTTAQIESFLQIG